MKALLLTICLFTSLCGHTRDLYNSRDGKHAGVIQVVPTSEGMIRLNECTAIKQHQTWMIDENSCEPMAGLDI